MAQDGYRSHPDKLLRDHLYEVATAARENVRGAGRDDLSLFAFLAGGLHDIGKYTDYFQEQLKRRVRVKCSDHAFISSLVAFNEAYRRTGNALYSVLVMDSVMSHHGDLKGLSSLHQRLRDELDRQSDGLPGCLSLQYDDLASKWGLIASELPWLDLGPLPALEDLLKGPNKQIYRLMGQRYSWKEYLDGLLLFSSLIDADKHSASGAEAGQGELPSPDLILKYVSSLGRANTPVDAMREELFSWALGFVPEEEVTSLIAPTGSGKTLSGTLIALRGGRRRVIYTLPFINIIEQTADVLARALGQDRVLAFHHLSYKWDDSRDEEDLEKRLIVAESWDSPVLVTTFEALVATFLSPKNAYLKRLHNLANSFLILDEVQALPLERIELVREGVEAMARHLNVKALIMTATMPIEVKNANRPVRTRPNRYVIRFGDLGELLSPEQLVSRLDLGGGSVMIEMNTIASAEAVFNSIRDLNPYFLSTHVIPKERMKRIAEIKNRLERGERVVLVTTQLVEAGVDLDFSRAYRDLGPIDSVIQAAGRVNRNGRGFGELSVYRIRRGEGASDFAKVYGALTEEVTLEALQRYLGAHHGDVQEKDIDGLLGVYLGLVKERISPADSRASAADLENIMALEFDRVNVQLIGEQPKNTVYVEADEQARSLWESLHAALNESVRDFSSRARLKSLIAQAQQYVVSTWGRVDQLSPDERLGWYYLPQDQLNKYYDENTGLRAQNPDPDEGVIW